MSSRIGSSTSSSPLLRCVSDSDGMRDVVDDQSARVAYAFGGRGPTVLFLHALGTDHSLWEAQAKSICSRRQWLAPDMRGHGATPPSGAEALSFERLANDLIVLFDRHAISKASVVGISVGGEIAQVLAALHPDRVERLLLVSTACVTRPDRAALWGERIAEAHANGMQAVAERAVRRWFTSSFQREHPEVVASWQSIVANTSLEGYVGIARTIQHMDLRPMLPKIACPTLVLSGDLDGATGPATGEEIGSLIPGAQHRVIEGAGHLWNLELPARFNAELARWLGDR